MHVCKPGMQLKYSEEHSSRTPAVFGESISNPNADALKIGERGASSMACRHRRHCLDARSPDQTQYGVDIVTHATTKYMMVTAPAWVVRSGSRQLRLMAHAEKFSDSPRRTISTMA